MNDKWFDRFFTGIIIAVIIFAAIQIAAVIFIGWKSVSALHDADWSHGLSGIVDHVWCGEKGCQK